MYQYQYSCTGTVQLIVLGILWLYPNRAQAVEAASVQQRHYSAARGELPPAPLKKENWHADPSNKKNKLVHRPPRKDKNEKK